MNLVSESCCLGLGALALEQSVVPGPRCRHRAERVVVL
jgi:hypothetical protein